MALFLNTGVPGSGKTYLMVVKFVDLFCTWDKETGCFVLKKEHENKILISNIAGLKLDHWDIETMMHERCQTLARKKYINCIGSADKKIQVLLNDNDMDDVIDEFYYEFMSEKVRWFFNMPFQKSLQEKHGGIIYLIEESQRYFDGKELGRQKWVRDVLYFFEKHRHVGASIFMDTQHASKLVKGISILCETETKALPRTFSVFGEFKYNEFSEGAKINQIPIVKKPDKRIFGTYKSMNAKEDVKTKKPIVKLLGFVVVVIIAGGFLLNYVRSNLGPGEAIAGTVEQVNKMPLRKVEPANMTNTAFGNAPVVATSKWERLSFTSSSKGFTVVHPITNVIMPLGELDLEVKRQGSSMLVKIPDNYL